MKNWIFPILLLAMWSCQQSPSSSAGGSSATSASVNLEGFTSERLSGSSTDYVVKRDGQGRVLEEGFMENGQKVGTWATYNPEKNEITALTPYIDGQINGRALTFDAGNRIQSQQGYKNGQLHGYAAKYNFSRLLEEFNYTNGQLNGEYKKYFDNLNQVQQESNYKNGQLDGTVTYYNKEGVKTLQYEYKNGEKVSGGIIEGK